MDCLLKELCCSKSNAYHECMFQCLIQNLIRWWVISKRDIDKAKNLKMRKESIIILTEIPLVVWYYRDTKKSASHIYHGNLMEKWTSKDRYTKQICLVTIWTYRARVICKSWKVLMKCNILRAERLCDTALIRSGDYS